MCPSGREIKSLVSWEHGVEPPYRGAPLAGHLAWLSLLRSKTGAQITLPRASVQLRGRWIPGGPSANHGPLRPLHLYYHGKLGRGEARSWAGYLEEKDLNK